MLFLQDVYYIQIFDNMNRIPVVTKNLLLINIIFFLAMLVGEKYGFDLDKYLSLHFILASDFNPAQLFTYMFMHANFAHIFFNMFAVWMFGSVLERYWGSSRFLLFYIVCGLGAGITQEIVQLITFYASGMASYDAVSIPGMLQAIPMDVYLNSWRTVGASGAIFGILLGFGMMFPNERMFVFPIPFPIKSKYFVIGYAVLELLLGVSNSQHDNVAHFAHLGGMLFGFFVILYWRRKRNR